MVTDKTDITYNIEKLYETIDNERCVDINAFILLMKTIKDMFNTNCIVLFGSYLYSSKYKDIDILIECERYEMSANKAISLRRQFGLPLDIIYTTNAKHMLKSLNITNYDTIYETAGNI